MIRSISYKVSSPPGSESYKTEGMENQGHQVSKVPMVSAVRRGSQVNKAQLDQQALKGNQVRQAYRGSKGSQAPWVRQEQLASRVSKAHQESKAQQAPLVSQAPLGIPDPGVLRGTLERQEIAVLLAPLENVAGQDQHILAGG